MKVSKNSSTIVLHVFTSAIEDLQLKAFFQTRYPQIYQGWIIYQKTVSFEDKHIISGSGLLQKDDRLFSMEMRKFCIQNTSSKTDKNRKTILSYNCAHIRWTKETLTIEYFRIILKKFG